MLKNSLVFILTDGKDNKVCDFVEKTCTCLARSDNDVVLINVSNSLSIKEILAHYIKNNKRCWHFIRKHNDYYQISPLLVIPFRRFNFILKLNISINLIFVYLLFFLKNPRKYSHKISWNFFPKFNYLISIFKFLNLHIHFDIVDFFISTDSIKNSSLLEASGYLLKKANTVSAISQTLKKRYQKIYNRYIEVVPQGFSFKNFKNYKKMRIKKEKPIIGFVGAVSLRIDVNLMKDLAKKNPQWNFLFVGPKKIDENILIDNMSFEKMDDLLSIKNVLWINSLPKKYIPSIIEFFDLAIIPYDLNYEFNKFCFPMKLYEYLYMNKQIISTPIEELKRFKGIVAIAKNSQEWAIEIQNSLDNLESKDGQLDYFRSLALNNTWDKKIDAISNHVLLNYANINT